VGFHYGGSPFAVLKKPKAQTFINVKITRRNTVNCSKKNHSTSASPPMNESAEWLPASLTGESVLGG
jgi:hypothetical protein